MIGLSYTENGKRVIDPNWRIIPGYDGMYEISSMGEVRSWKNNRYPGRAKKPEMCGTSTKGITEIIALWSMTISAPTERGQ